MVIDPTEPLRLTISQLALDHLDDTEALVSMIERAEFVILTHSERSGLQHIDPLIRCTLTDGDREALEGLGITTQKAIKKHRNLTCLENELQSVWMKPY